MSLVSTGVGWGNVYNITHGIMYKYSSLLDKGNKTEHYVPNEFSGETMSQHDVNILLQKARNFYTQSEIAKCLDVDVRTVRRWENGECEPPSYLSDAILQRLLSTGTSEPQMDNKFSFIDLFAGIGGMRTGFESHEGHCVFTSEWNSFSQKTYVENFPQKADHILVGDITEVNENDVPDHDVLVAGFPCQPFSIAGVSKKNSLGRPHGFECTTQGTPLMST
jgi:DNA (cytosine-5)-methyltransferase 1